MTIRGKKSRAMRGMSVAMAAAIALLAACNKDRILDVTDPDVINPTDVASAPAAEALRLGALARVNDATSGGSGGSLGEGAFFFGGLLADEWRSGDTFFQRDETDQRSIQDINSGMTVTARQLYRMRTSAVQAIPALKQYLPLQVSSVGQMYWVRGYAETLIAENFCNGTPVSSLGAANEIIEGAPETNAQVYARALASFDSALLNAPAGEARSDTVKWLAGIGKARVLTNLGQYQQAAAALALANVPDNFRFLTFHSQATVDNQIWALNNSAGRYVVGERDGTVGLNFATANDPRVPVCVGGSAACRALDPGQTRAVSFDNNFGAGTVGGPFYVQMIFPTREADVAISTGTEARLVEAEASLRSGDVTGFLAKLNFMRANFNTFKQPANPCTATGTTITGCPVIPAGGNLLAPLTDPGTQAAREDLLFRERAFWLFSTGHRLPDLRRLVRPASQGGFGRPESTVYPNGTFLKGGVYGTDKMLVIPTAEQNNSLSKGCTDRNP